MSDLLQELTDFRDSTPGRRLFSVRQTKQRAQALPEEQVDQELFDTIDRALEINEEARSKRNWWRRDRQVDEHSRTRANELDNELDRTVGALHETFKATRKAFRDGPRGETAAEILETLFPDGAAGFTTLAFEDELSAVRFLVEQLDANWSDEVDELGARAMVNQLSSLADRFADALSESEDRKTSWDEVRAADNEGQKAMLRVVVDILGRFNQPGEVATARRLLAPIIEQDERIGDLHRRNRRIIDVDPETGEEVTDPEDSGDGDTDETPTDG